MVGKKMKCLRLVVIVLAVVGICSIVAYFDSSKNINNWIKTQKLPSFPTLQWPDQLWSPQSAVCNESESDGEQSQPGKPLLIPSDMELDKLNEKQLAELYWKYINTVQALCRNQTRLGSFKDGGKEICVDNEFIPHKPCLVYSFGSNFQFDFEYGVLMSFGCEVHTFDPTMNLKQPLKTVPANVHFQLKGLSGHNHVTVQKWEMRTLETIMKELGHENKTIDILKIDIDGGEYASLNHMFKAGTLQRAKQLSIEIHYGNEGPRTSNWGGVSTKEQLKVLRGLYDDGFKIFMREHNLFSIKPFRTVYNTVFTNVNEISLINERFKN